jgi:hypothetical protein
MSIRQNITTTATFEHLGHYGSAVTTHAAFEDAVAAAAEWQTTTSAKNAATYEGLDITPTPVRAFVCLRIASHAGSSEAARWEIIDGTAVLIPSGQGGLSTEQSDTIRAELAQRAAVAS